MPQAAISEPLMLHPEQDTMKKPWEREEGESAKWFFRFRNFLALGPTRSIRAVFEAEKQTKAVIRSYKCGETWYSAARRYHWAVRADAWDNEQDEQKAAQMREIAMKCAFTSRPYRIAQLNSMAEGLSRALEKDLDVSISLAMVKQLTSLMQEIAKEIDAWGVHFDASCDAAALDALKQKYQRMQEITQEREAIEEEKTEKMLEYCLQHGLV